MQGGAISGNTSVTAGLYSRGGGVCVAHEADFTMRGGTVSGNVNEIGGDGGYGGGVEVREQSAFVMESGTIYGNAESLPAGTDASLANTINSQSGASLSMHDDVTAKWGTGGTYIKGGVSQRGGSDIGSTNDTLIAVPAR
jgi:hypothetical protein